MNKMYNNNKVFLSAKAVRQNWKRAWKAAVFRRTGPKPGGGKTKFFQNPTFAFMHNILLSYLGKPLHFFPSSCLFTVDNAKNAIEQHQNKQNSSRACGAENAILKPQKWGPPAVNLMVIKHNGREKLKAL